MRRLAAHLALAAIYAGFFAPLLVAQESTLHACCLRSGAHHCQGTSSEEAGFHSRRSTCPYAAQLPPAGSFGLEPAKFSITVPANIHLLLHSNSAFHLLIAVCDLSARAPPALL